LKEYPAIRPWSTPRNRAKSNWPLAQRHAILTDIAVTAAAASEPDDGQPMKFKIASADYSQDGYSVANAIDDDPKSGWGIYPQVTQPHAAVFELAEPIHNEAAWC